MTQAYKKPVTKLHGLFGAAIAGLAATLMQKEISSRRDTSQPKRYDTKQLNSYYKSYRNRKYTSSRSYPHSSTQEAARRKRQLDAGTLHCNTEHYL